jgi:hypothetical protein
VLTIHGTHLIISHVITCLTRLLLQHTRLGRELQRQEPPLPPLRPRFDARVIAHFKIGLKTFPPGDDSFYLFSDSLRKTYLALEEVYPTFFKKVGWRVRMFLGPFGYSGYKGLDSIVVNIHRHLQQLADSPCITDK